MRMHPNWVSRARCNMSSASPFTARGHPEADPFCSGDAPPFRPSPGYLARSRKLWPGWARKC
jgi:hypothetical protein